RERADHEKDLKHGCHVDDPHGGHDDHGDVGPPDERAPWEGFRIPTTRTRARGSFGRADLKNPDELRYVFERLVAEVLFAQPELVSYLVPHGSGYADGTGIGEPLKAGGYVDPLSVDPIALHHNVTEVNSDAKLHPSLREHIGVLGP